MKTYKTIFSIVIIIIFVFSCKPSFHDQYYEKIQGSWRISDFEHIDYTENKIIDLTWPERYYTIGFENHNHLFFVKRENRNPKFVRATYEIFKENDTLKIRIVKSDDVRLEGVYDLYIDTLSQTNLHYRVQLSLDSENTYLSALRMKSKQPVR